eukprot:symbB.v1.2.007578.t1/scaffold386.1/size215569/4
MDTVKAKMQAQVGFISGQDSRAELRSLRENLHVAHGLAMSGNERRSPRARGERVCDTPQCGWPSVHHRSDNIDRNGWHAGHDVQWIFQFHKSGWCLFHRP